MKGLNWTFWKFWIFLKKEWGSQKGHHVLKSTKSDNFLQIIGLWIIQLSFEVIYNCKEYSCAYAFLNFTVLKLAFVLQWILSISTTPTLCLESFPFLYRNLGPLDIYVTLKPFFSLYLEQPLSRISLYL